jgi:integrase/recombinase XerD
MNEQRKDKNGKYPIRIRSTIAGKLKYYKTGINVLETQWDKLKGEVINHPNRHYLNADINQKISEMEKRFVELSLAGNDVSELPDENLTYFHGYAEALIKKRKQVESPSSIKVKNSRLRKFNDFNSKIKLIDCTPRVLDAFENHCRKLGNVENTVSCTMSFVKMIIKAAYRDGTITHDPSRDYKKAKYKDPDRQYLTEAEIAKIAKYIDDEGKHSNEANWFLFSCYCGLRFGDVAKFDKSRIDNDRITLRTSKTGATVSIKIHARLKTVIDRLGKNPVSTQKYNAKLKLIATSCEIEKPLSSHIARHTFAVLFLTLGGSMEVLSKLMGHAKQSVTQIYGKIVDKRIDDEVDRVFG